MIKALLSRFIRNQCNQLSASKLSKEALLWSAIALVLVVLAGCSSHPPAKVRDRSSSIYGSRYSVNAVHANTPLSYIVKKGDTLFSIGFRYGIDFHKLAMWNGIRKPYTIQIGQSIRLKAPTQLAKQRQSSSKHQSPSSTRTKRSSTTKPLVVNKAKTSPSRPIKVVTKPKAQITNNKPEKKPIKTYSSNNKGKIRWQWPVNGKIITRFSASDSARNGINIAARSGINVKAAAAGVVVYSGNGLRGYGELIIIKHNDLYLSAYAHNKQRKVREGDQIKAGQVIALLGQTGTDRPMLHFEVRFKGKPVDPLKYLPAR
ncbi:MAG: peptidoglycan DD-metalloendopeptidase family protein [bacterium]